MADITLKTNRRNEIIDITQQVNGRLPAALKVGICHIFCPHTTAASALMRMPTRM